MYNFIIEKNSAISDKKAPFNYPMAVQYEQIRIHDKKYFRELFISMNLKLNFFINIIKEFRIRKNEFIKREDESALVGYTLYAINLIPACLLAMIFAPLVDSMFDIDWNSNGQLISMSAGIFGIPSMVKAIKRIGKSMISSALVDLSKTVARLLFEKVGL